MLNEELLNVYGGVSFSGTLLNSIVKAITSIYDIGRRLGSALVRYKTGNVCPLN